LALAERQHLLAAAALGPSSPASPGEGIAQPAQPRSAVFPIPEDKSGSPAQSLALSPPAPSARRPQSAGTHPVAVAAAVIPPVKPRTSRVFWTLLSAGAARGGQEGPGGQAAPRAARNLSRDSSSDPTVGVKLRVSGTSVSGLNSAPAAARCCLAGFLCFL